MIFKIGGEYQWIGQPKPKLVYLGLKDGWHEFAKFENPSMVWCRIAKEAQLLIEETKEN